MSLSQESLNPDLVIPMSLYHLIFIVCADMLGNVRQKQMAKSVAGRTVASCLRDKRLTSYF